MSCHRVTVRNHSSPARRLPRGASRLRYFEYHPPLGGFGGDWDSLDAEAEYASGDELAVMLGALGYVGELPPPDAVTYLGMAAVNGERVQLDVDGGRFVERGRGRLAITIAVYVKPEDIARAERFEVWLDAQGIRMTPRSRLT